MPSFFWYLIWKYCWILKSCLSHHLIVWLLKLQNLWEDLAAGDSDTVRGHEAALSLLKPSLLNNDISGDYYNIYSHKVGETLLPSLYLGIPLYVPQGTTLYSINHKSDINHTHLISFVKLIWVIYYLPSLLLLLWTKSGIGKSKESNLLERYALVLIRNWFLVMVVHWHVFYLVNISECNIWHGELVCMRPCVGSLAFRSYWLIFYLINWPFSVVHNFTCGVDSCSEKSTYSCFSFLINFARGYHLLGVLKRIENSTFILFSQDILNSFENL